MFSEVCTSTIFRLSSIVDLKRHSTSYIRHLSHRSMYEPEKHYKTFGSIEHIICDKRTKRWVGGAVRNCFCICKQPHRLLRAQIGKNYPRCNSHYQIIGNVKIKNNIPVSPDKWIYE